jgi:hypothetical protein
VSTLRTREISTLAVYDICEKYAKFEKSFPSMMKLSLLVVLGLAVTNLHAIVLSPSTAQVAGHRQPEGIRQAALDMGIGVNSESEPTPFPFWENIGTVGMGTGLYLGNGWVLTSTHVGCLPFRLSDGSYYQPIKGTWNVIVNPDGSKSDMALFRVEEGKEASAIRCLQEVPLSTVGMESKTPVILVGTGYVERQMEVEGTVQFGIQQRTTREKRWALATTDEVAQPAATLGGYKTHCFATTFRAKASGGQAAEGDSGGAAFIFDAEARQWKLAGCIFAVSQLNSFVPYGARTYVGDLAMYSSQIEERLKDSK